MNKPTTASIIVINYNYARFLPFAIDSALAQTHGSVEVIVVDDGSTDNSRDVISSYGERIRPVFKKNGGQGSAFNAGFEVATGEAIFFLDADDAMLPETVQRVLAAWQPGAVLVQYRLNVIDGEGQIVGMHPEPWERLEEGDVSHSLLNTGGFAMSITSGLAYSREILKKVMPLPPTIVNAADGCLNRAVGLFGKVQRIDEPLALYRRHGGNDSDAAASADRLAAFFRKKIMYTKNEHAFMRTFADQLGLHCAPDLGERDSAFLNSRLLSLSLDPAAHPFEQDQQLDLLLRYLKLRCFESDPVSRRMVDVATAIGLVVAPTQARTTLARWRHQSRSRPPWLVRLGTILKSGRPEHPSSSR
jgi:glycosyltransferase involved in cell wall biosynthesis